MSPAPQAVAWLLGVPGASSTVLEVAVPYCRDSLVGLLGQVWPVVSQLVIRALKPRMHCYMHCSAVRSAALCWQK